MGSVFSGKQILAFFQDPNFWGAGQRIEGLKLRINGNLIEEKDFDKGWDLSDIQPGDYVEVLSGVWVGRGWTLPNHGMAHVVEFWHGGIKPNPPLTSVPQPVLAPLLPPVPAPQPSGIRRPVFMPS